MDTMGKYQLLRQLGRGGMAEVFLALETGPAALERLVVLKRVLPELAGDSKFTTMFLDEARIAMRLNHPNVAHVYEVGQHDGQHYLVMEFVHGADLRAVLRRYQQLALTPAQAALIAARTASALHHAHNLKSLRGDALNVVHRDISPSNICISHEGIVKVLDFGIAKASTNLNQTMLGVLKGKYPYMSPEQAQGDPLDGRSDLFSLGIVLYETLTYRRLFKRANEAESLEALFKLQIPPPSTFNRLVPPELDKIVLRMLERDRQRRYPTAQEAEGEMEAYLRQDPATAADLARVMSDIFGDTRQLSALVHELLAGDSQGELLPSYTPSRSLPPVADSQGGERPTAGPVCEHCGEVHSSDHMYCPETGRPIADRLPGLEPESSDVPTMLVNKPLIDSAVDWSSPADTRMASSDADTRPERALPDHLFAPSPEEEVCPRLTTDSLDDLSELTLMPRVSRGPLWVVVLLLVLGIVAGIVWYAT